VTILVNADDYRHDEIRTRAIQEAFRLGAITATTAMANRPWFERAMKEATDLGFRDKIGLHFNISEGEPLTDEMRSCAELCDASGCFAPRFHQSFKGRLILPANATRAIRAEARAQMQKYLDCGGTLMHLDSHHHVHTDFSVTPELYDEAKKFGFVSARLSRNLCNGLPFSKRLYKVVWNAYSRRLLPARVDYFGGFGDFASCYQNLHPDAWVEVMVHPLYRKNGALSLDGELCDAEKPMTQELAFWNELVLKGLHITGY